MTHHVAQVNVARMRGPIKGPVMAEFQRALDPVNLLAERSPGFVWRLQDEAGDATAIPFSDDALVIVNLSTWESVDALRDYTYRSGHTHYLKRRKEWFELHTSPHYALWWVPAGHHPTPGEARDRLARLDAHGPTAEAFLFTHLHAPPTDG